MSSGLDLDHLRGWIGSREILEDRCEAVRVRQLAVSLDLDPAPFVDGAELPPLWHWIFTTPVSPLRETGPDGHPARGGFLPPVPLPRRMWAASQLEWLRAPRLGEPLAREATVESVDLKQGKSGALVFVKVRHELKSAGELLLREGQDIVYREAPPASRAQPNAPAQGPVWREPLGANPARCALVPDDVLLFRYSALIFNSHRIHYDRRYCLEVDGYPGLVVHGPLLATVMATLAWLQADRRAPRAFSFRALAPVFDAEAITVHSAREGATAKTEVKKADGTLAQAGEMTWNG